MHLRPQAVNYLAFHHESLKDKVLWSAFDLPHVLERVILMSEILSDFVNKKCLSTDDLL